MNSGATTCRSSLQPQRGPHRLLASRRGQSGTLTQEARPRGHRPRGARGARDRSAGLRARVQRLRDESLLRARCAATPPSAPFVWRSEVASAVLLRSPGRPGGAHALTPRPRDPRRTPHRSRRPRSGRSCRRRVRRRRPPGSTRAVSARASALLSNVVGGGTDAVPGLGGVTFRPGAGNTHFDRVYAHPTGHWVLTAFADLPSDRDECLIGSGELVAREGSVAPWIPGGAELCGTLDQRCAVEFERRVRLRDQLLGDRRRRLDRDPPRGRVGPRGSRGGPSLASPVRPWTMPSTPVSCSTTGAPATRLTGSTGSVRCRSTTSWFSGSRC